MTAPKTKHTVSLIRLLASAPKRDLHPKPKDGQPEYDLGEDLDEVLIGDWLHLEWMSDTNCWMRIGDVDLNVFFSPEGAVAVNVKRGAHGAARGETRVSKGVNAE